MAQPRTATCEPWATSADLCSPCDDYTVDQALMDDALQAASDVLYVLSGRQFPGECSETLYVEKRWLVEHSGLDPAVRPRPWWPRPGADRITLGLYPLIDVTSVTIDGAVVDPASYRIDDFRWLTKIDGSAWTWSDTFKVEATYGQSPPEMGIRAAATLACQLYLACQPETVDGCRLPERVTNVTRQGVSFVLLDPFDFLEAGKTGLYDVDLFLSVYNPNRLRRRPTVMSPDIPRRVRRRDT